MSASVGAGCDFAVADTLREAAIRVGFARVGIQDCFGEGGTTTYLFAKYGLTATEIVQAYWRASERRGQLRKSQ